MAREWNINNSEPQGPFARKLLITLLVVVLMGSIAVGVFLLTGEQRSATILADFERALQEERYTEAIELYRIAQEKSLSDSWLDQHQDKFRQALAEMEKITGERLDAIESRLLQGQALSVPELSFSAQMAEVSAVRLVPFLRKLCADYLQGSMRLNVLEKAFAQLGSLDNLIHVVGKLPDEFDQMSLAQPYVMSGLAKLADQDYWLAWNLFDDLLNDQALSGFVHEQVRLLKNECESEMYDPLLNDARALMAGGRYLSARDALRELEVVFPDDQAILADLAECDRQVPAVMVQYSGPVEVISILPLIVNTERAFAGGNQTSAVRDSMLTVGEFRSLLSELHANNYILIDYDRLYDEQRKRTSLILPEGKKPLILVLEGLNYYAARRQTGNSWDLILDENGEVCAVYPDVSGKMIVDREGEAIGILDLFVKEFPDFSHDGAKGTIALTGYECVFGKVTDQNQLGDRNRALQDMGYAPVVLSADELEANRREAQAIADRLLETGWRFASFTYGLINVRNSTMERIQDDTAKWLEQVGQITGPVGFYNYPFGAFLTGSDDRAAWLREQGFVLFGGQGTTAYLFAGEGYIYVDKTPISGFTLRNSQTYRLSRLIDASKVYDKGLRGG